MKKLLKEISTILLSSALLFNFSSIAFAKNIDRGETYSNNNISYKIELKKGNDSNDGLVRVKLDKDKSDYITLKPSMFFTSEGENGTHQFIVKKALTILKNDKGEKVSNFIQTYEKVLKQYCDMPDKDEKDYAFAYHFYNPYTGENYLPSFLTQSKITALIKFREHASNAVSNYNSDRQLAIEELGRACHFLEDVNVPYHSANLIAVLTTHSEYEKFVEENQQNYIINTSDKYNNYSSISFEAYCNSILKDCAIHSYSFKDKVKNDKNSWNYVADDTVKYAEQYVAAFFYRFLQEVGEI